LASESVSITDSTISGNSALYSGGGIVATGDVTITRSTITGNIADSDGDGRGEGGGLATNAVTMSHSVVAQNIGGDVRRVSSTVASKVTANYSLIGDNAGTNLAEAPLGSPDAKGNLIGGPVFGAIDPLLGPLADNGGVLTLPGGARLLTHTPLAGSPLIDAGDAALEAGVGETPAFDQRGAPFSRVVGARIDIGAVESIGGPIVVDTLMDESDGDFSKGDLSLREAIELANAQPGADEIVFDPALFASGPGTILLTRGELAIAQSLTVAGPGAALLTIDASGSDPTPAVDNADGVRAFSDQVRPGPGPVPVPLAISLSGMTITGGDVSGRGGAVNAFGRLTLTDCVISDNAASTGGGGVWAGETVLADSIIRGNRSGDTAGGVFATQLTVRNSVIEGNTSHGHGGGAIAISVEMTNALVAENHAGSLNQAADGGGLYVLGSQPATLTQTTFASNEASGLGGAIFAASAGQWTTLLQTTITGNAARTGAGVYGHQLSVLRSTVTDNVPVGNGGDFVAGGGIWARSMTLDHSIVAQNNAGNAPASDVSGFTTARWSVIGDGRSTSLAEAPVGSPDANGNLVGGSVHGVIDPNLGPLAYNGGPTLPGGARLLTHVPQPGSPVIDAGHPGLLPGVGSAPEFDQRGAPYSRLTGSRVDIGAVESQAVGGALSGDFNFDGRVDGSDFLAWQRGLGRTAVVTIRHGDATADGDVDANDLAVWKARAGEGKEGVRGQESGVSPSGGNLSPSPSLRGRGSDARDAVFAAGDFSGLFAVGNSPNTTRGRWRPARRG
jgi:predicted outer membrane repeat protein